MELIEVASDWVKLDDIELLPTLSIWHVAVFENRNINYKTRIYYENES